jgi:hypothetical protein
MTTEASMTPNRLRIKQPGANFSNFRRSLLESASTIPQILPASPACHRLWRSPVVSNFLSMPPVQVAYDPLSVEDTVEDANVFEAESMIGRFSIADERGEP